ncbi:MAG TPA: hypothetical protein PK999_18890 [Nitrospira sp.]|nr:hypothetical protein [Nitrospira sp.]
MSHERNAILNQPFEFDELLISPQARRSIGQLAQAQQVFSDSDNEPAVLKGQFATRKLAVRLRTIDNACAADSRLSDGRPLTIVSLYGSRDRQFVLGPYAAVKHLISGYLPAEAHSRIREAVDAATETVTRVVTLAANFLADPQSGSTSSRALARQKMRNESGRGLMRGTGYDLDISFSECLKDQYIDLYVGQIESIRDFGRTQ